MKKYICRICGKGTEDIKNGYLTRVNEFGGAAIWECRPNCSSCDVRDNDEEEYFIEMEVSDDGDEN